LAEAEVNMRITIPSIYVKFKMVSTPSQPSPLEEGKGGGDIGDVFPSLKGKPVSSSFDHHP
jgi:hypothetical protein